MAEEILHIVSSGALGSCDSLTAYGAMSPPFLVCRVAGYGPCLAATNHLHAAKVLAVAITFATVCYQVHPVSQIVSVQFQCLSLQLLGVDTPGKVGGPPGNAFELVYTAVTDSLREKMHNVDPVLAEYIR